MSVRGRPPTIAREDLVRRIAAVFRARGYDGASLTHLAAATGLVRASLYHAFPDGKAGMARAVIAAVDADVAAQVLAPLAAPGAPRARLAAMAEGFGRLYDGGTGACALNLFSIGEAGALFRDAVATRIAALTDAIAAALVEAGLEARVARERAQDALIAIQGALALSRMTGDAGPFARTLAALPERLLAPA